MGPQRTDRILLAALLVLAAAVVLGSALLMPPARTGDTREHPSTFFNAPYGTKAAYLALARLGYDVSRLRRPIDIDTLDGIDALIMLRPVQGLSRHEQVVLLAWVGAGHPLLVAPQQNCPTCGGPDEISLETWFKFSDTTAEGDDLVLKRAGESLGLLENTQELPARPGRRFDPNQPLAGPLAHHDATGLWQDAAGFAAVRIPCGKGLIIALADVHALSNEGLRASDSPVWLANLARELTGGDTARVLAFDEYHAGFPYHEVTGLAIARLFLGAGWGAGVAQVLAVGALALFALGVRFGRPADVQVRRRRHTGEFVAAAGRLLCDAGATDVAAEALARHYLSRAGPLTHTPMEANEAATVARLRERGYTELADLLSARLPPRRARRQLLEWSRRIERHLECLAHGT